MTTTELCQWLRDNSSGIYRPAAEAADLIEAQAREIERLKLLVNLYRAEVAEHDPIGYPAFILEPPQ